MGSSSYQCPLWIFFVRALLGCFGLVIASALICSFVSEGYIFNSLKWCGKNSLDIMCLHIPVKGIAVIMVTMILHPLYDVQSSALLSFIAFTLTFILMTPVVIVINKIFRK